MTIITIKINELKESSQVSNLTGTSITYHTSECIPQSPTYTHNAQLIHWTDLHTSECIPQSPMYTLIIHWTDLHTSECIPQSPTYTHIMLN